MPGLGILFRQSLPDSKMVYRFWHWFTGKASIRKKLIISFAVLVSIPITILGVYSFHVSNRNLLDQTKKTVDNNLGRLVMEMEAWFGRETDFTKFLAYHLSFRETLEKNPFDNVEIAQVLNKTVEPIFWYFIQYPVFQIIHALRRFQHPIQKKFRPHHTNRPAGSCRIQHRPCGIQLIPLHCPFRPEILLMLLIPCLFFINAGRL